MSAPRIINGTPGTRWTNDTKKVRYQRIVSWINSCGRCIAQDHAISTSKWPLPAHRFCSCKQIPIYPGKESLPFIDFRAEIDRLPAYRRQHVIGKAALALVDNHVLRWPDVVLRDRIKSLNELVARHKLTVERMTAAGVDRRTAQAAFDQAHGHDADALAEAHRKALAAEVAAKAEQQRQAKEAARARLAAAEAKAAVRAKTPKAVATAAEAGSARVLADYLRRGKVKISSIENVVEKRFGKINAEAEARRLKAEAAQKPPKLTAAEKRRLAKEAAEAKAREKTERGLDAAQVALKRRMEAAPTQHARFEVVHDWLRANMAPARPIREHGMANEEDLHRVEYGGRTYWIPPVAGTYEAGTGHPLAYRIVAELQSPAARLPGRLRAATREVIFTKQPNKDDDYWKKHYNDPNHSIATGADGTIVVYNGRNFHADVDAHESGHNLAGRIYGGTMPAPGSDYHRAIRSGEPPVSPYAANSDAEDFAEAWKYYVRNREHMRLNHPERFAVIDRLATDPHYEDGGAAAGKPKAYAPSTAAAAPKPAPKPKVAAAPVPKQKPAPVPYTQVPAAVVKVRARLDAYTEGDRKVEQIRQFTEAHAAHAEAVRGHEATIADLQAQLKGAKGKAAKEALNEQLGNAERKLYAAMTEKRKAEGMARHNLLSVLATDDPMAIDHGGTLDSLKGEAKASAEAALGFWSKILGKGKPDVFAGDVAKEGATKRITDRVEVKLHTLPAGEHRAYYQEGGVHLAEHVQDVATAVHELGHMLEEHVPGWSLAAQAFLRHRVGDEPLTQLKSLKIPGTKFGAGEWGRKDQWEDAFGELAWYVGKDYGPSSSEITAMGIQKLFEDPGGFVRRDPEYAKFLIGLLSGHLR